MCVTVQFFERCFFAHLPTLPTVDTKKATFFKCAQNATSS